MRLSMRGHWLPESEAEYVSLHEKGELKFKECSLANHAHYGRTHTSLGWAETQISGACEDCYDALELQNGELS